MSAADADLYADPAEFERECQNCGGTGYSSHDCGEDACVCLAPEDNVVCDWCGGEG